MLHPEDFGWTKRSERTWERYLGKNATINLYDRTSYEHANRFLVKLIWWGRSSPPPLQHVGTLESCNAQAIAWLLTLTGD